MKASPTFFVLQLMVWLALLSPLLALKLGCTKEGSYHVFIGPVPFINTTTISQISNYENWLIENEIVAQNGYSEEHQKICQTCFYYEQPITWEGRNECFKPDLSGVDDVIYNFYRCKDGRGMKFSCPMDFIYDSSRFICVPESWRTSL